MTALPDNIEALLDKLTANSRNELELIRTLSEAIRRVDDQLLREIRSVSVAHEIRRETIVGELQTLANRLCALPVRSFNANIKPAIAGAGMPAPDPAEEINNGPASGSGADWRQAAQNIDDDDFSFVIPAPRH